MAARAGGGAEDVGGLLSLAAAAAPGNGALRSLLAGGTDAPGHVIAVPISGEPVYLTAPPISSLHVVVPGSFNPLHEGHEALARETALAAGLPPGAILLELCSYNADKGSLPLEEAERRIAAAAQRGYKMLVTRASLYRDKAQLCRGCAFAVGYDTYRRIVDPKYYAPPGCAAEEASSDERRAWLRQALLELKACGVRLYVGGRVHGGEFRELEQSPLEEAVGDMSDLFIPLANFRMDISSTELRARAAAEGAAPAA